MNKAFLTSLLIMFLLLPVSEQRALNVVFIGNSITYGALHKQPKKTAPPVVCAEWLAQHEDIGPVYFANCGKSGRTTFNFIPLKGDKNQNFYPWVVKHAQHLTEQHPHAQLVFSMMLGTNDAAERPFNSLTTPYMYEHNIRLIINSLAQTFPQANFVIHKTIWHSLPFTTRNGSYMSKNSCKLYGQYYKACRAIASDYPDHVFLGDSKAYDYFRKHEKSMLVREKGYQDMPFWLHPNEEGSARLAEFWGEAIIKAVKGR
jgi:lysophospholipase L1-like esterase